MITVPIFDPFDPADPDPLGSLLGHSLGRFLDFETRRALVARGGGSGGGAFGLRPSRASRLSGQRAGSPRGRRGPSQAAGSHSIREAIGSLRYSVRTAEKTARAKARETGKAAREAAYASRVYVRTKATEARNLARQIEKEYLASERAAARERRLLAHFLTPAARRTRYQRRVVSGVSRQLERGEHPSIARAVGRGREKETASPQQINRLLRYREYLHETFGDQFTGQPNNPLQSEH